MKKKEENIHHRQPTSKGGKNYRSSLAKVNYERHGLWTQVMGNYGPIVYTLITRKLFCEMDKLALFKKNTRGDKNLLRVIRKEPSELLYPEYDCLQESFLELFEYNLTQAKRNAFFKLFEGMEKDVILWEINNVWGYPDFVLEETTTNEIISLRRDGMLSANDNFLFPENSSKTSIPAIK